MKVGRLKRYARRTECSVLEKQTTSSRRMNATVATLNRCASFRSKNPHNRSGSAGSGDFPRERGPFAQPTDLNGPPGDFVTPNSSDIWRTYVEISVSRIH